MSYLGKVDMNDANIKHYSLTGSTLTTVDIGWVPPSEQSLRVTINGVVQQGGTFSISGSNLTLGGALIATDDLEVVGIQSVGNIVTPADSSVSTAKLADDSVTLDKMAGLARGKIIVGDASGDPSALTVGAANQVLKSDGADVSWGADSSGALEFISRTTVNSVVSDISVNSGISATYDNYRMVFSNLVVDNHGASIYWGFRTTTSGTVADGTWMIGGWDDASSTVRVQQATSGSLNLAKYVTHDGGWNGSVDIYNPFSSTIRTAYTGLGRNYSTDLSQFWTVFFGGTCDGTQSEPHIKIWPSSGDIGDASIVGYIDLYGYKKS